MLFVKLKWWFMFVCSLALVGVCWKLGYLKWLWKADPTYLSWAAIGLFFAFSTFIGWLTTQQTYVIKEHLSSCWLAAELLMGLGMMGTVLGFLIMLTDVFNGGVPNPADVLTKAAPGLATVCVTTLVGLVTSFGLKIHLVNLEYRL